MSKLNRKLIIFIGMIILFSMLFSTVVIAQSETITGEPNVEIFVTDNNIIEDETQTIYIQIDNSKTQTDFTNIPDLEEEMSTMKNSEIEITSNTNDIEIKSYNLPSRTISPSNVKTVPVEIEAGEIDGDEIDLDIDLTYDYVNEITFNTSTDTIENRNVEENVLNSQQINLQVQESAFFDVTVEEESVAKGEEGYMNIDVENVGNIDVSEAVLELESGTSNILFGDSQSTKININELDESESKDFDINVKFSDTMSHEDYYIDGKITYDGGEYELNEIAFIPDSTTYFSMSDLSSDVPIGGSGDTTFTVENRGNQDINDAKINFESNSESILLSNSRTNSKFIGDIDSGEDIELTVPVNIQSTSREYSFDVDIDYENKHGYMNNRDIGTLDIEPKDEQSISTNVSDVQLNQGETGTIEFTIENDGPYDTENYDIKLHGNDNLQFLTENKVVDEIEMNESAEITTDAKLDSTLYSENQQITMDITYEDANNNVYEISKNHNIDVMRNNLFQIEVEEDIDIQVGDSKEFDIFITNNQNDDISNVNIDINSNDPLINSPQSIYIDEFNSDETELVNARVSTENDALSNTYPLSITITYENENHITKTSSEYYIPIDVAGGEPVSSDDEDSSITDSIPSLTTIVLGIIGLVILYLIVDIAIYYKNNKKKVDKFIAKKLNK